MRKICCIICAAMLAILPVWAKGADADEAAAPLAASAKSAVLISADDGSVIWEHNAHERLAMASTTKIMTALLTLEEAERSGDPELTVTEEMVRVEGSSMGLKPGDRLTLTNLTAGMLLASGNDAANAAALYLSGSQEDFAVLMNARAAEIDMEDSHFVTPSGLDGDEHYSTAYDMAILAREALLNREFRRIAGSSSLQVEFLEPPRRISYSNHNKLLRIYEGCIGVKTGFTKKAGRCLVSAAQRDGTTLIAVTLDAPDDWNDHMAMLDYGFATVKSLILGGEELPELAVVGGAGDSVPLTAGEPVGMTLPVAQAQEVSCQLILPRFAYAPVQEGQQVGELRYMAKGETIYTVPVRAAAGAEALPVPEKSGWEGLLEKIKEWLG